MNALHQFALTTFVMCATSTLHAHEELIVPEAVRNSVTREYGDSFEPTWHTRTDDTGTHYFAEWDTPEAAIWLELSEDGTIVNRRITDEPLHSHDASGEVKRSLDGVLDDRRMPMDREALPSTSNDPLRQEQIEQIQEEIQQEWQQRQNSNTPPPNLWDGAVPNEDTPLQNR